MEIWSEFVADHDTKLGSYKLSFNPVTQRIQYAPDHCNGELQQESA